jgi:sugar phosphate isomerase/epimerase
MTLPRLGGHLPWAQSEAFLERMLELGLTPEIAFKGPELDNLDEPLLEKVALRLAAARVRPTVHAPFFDLNPGALDPLIRQATVQRLSQAQSAAGRLNAHLMVIHPGVDKWRYPNLEQTWLALAKETFSALIRRGSACDCRLAIENIYEETPETLVQLVQEIDSEWFGHCFDAGHWHLFGKCSMAEWLNAIGPQLFHLHLHDNHGRADEHLPIGAGTIDFAPLKRWMKSVPARPSITLEAHTPEHLQQSMNEVHTLL